jgi:soluble lytic murein transglycosylase-like protein
MTQKPIKWHASQWRALIQLTLGHVWPDMPNGLHWIEAQINAESGGDPKAVSKSRAVGLMQLMPGTAAEMGVLNPLDPHDNLTGGIKYLKIQYDHLAEIPTIEDRLKASWASYNCGRGYINKAMAINRSFVGHTNDWWQWQWIAWALQQSTCEIMGRHPNWRETLPYVERIWAYKSPTGE